jgi:hypothetical protein
VEAIRHLKKNNLSDAYQTVKIHVEEEYFDKIMQE